MSDETVTQSEEADSSDTSFSSRWVWTGIFAALILFAASAGLLCFHWLTTQDPNCTIVVTTDGKLSQDAVITLFPVLDPKNKTVVKGSDIADGQIRFHVPRNDYQLVIIEPKLERIILDRPVIFSDNSKLLIYRLGK